MVRTCLPREIQSWQMSQPMGVGARWCFRSIPTPHHRVNPRCITVSTDICSALQHRCSGYEIPSASSWFHPFMWFPAQKPQALTNEKSRHCHHCHIHHLAASLSNANSSCSQVPLQLFSIPSPPSECCSITQRDRWVLLGPLKSRNAWEGPLHRTQVRHQLKLKNVCLHVYKFHC